MGAFQRLPKGRPWGGFHSPWRCWACRPCWALSWCRPSIMSTTATQPRSCRSSLRIRRQAWWWKRWFMMVPTATAGFLRRFFHPLRLLRHRQMREPQPPQQSPQPRTQQQNIHHRPHPPHPLLHPLLRPLPPPHLLRPHPQQQRRRQQQQQQQRQMGPQQAQQRAQEEEEEQQRQIQGPEEELALQTKSEPPQSSGRRQRQDRVQYFWTPPMLPTPFLPELKTSLLPRRGAQNLN